MNGLRQLRGQQRLLAGLLGVLNAVIPKSQSKIMVHSRPDGEDGALAIIHGLVSRGYQPIMLCESPVAKPVSTAIPQAPVRAVHKNTGRGWYHFLTAGLVITTHAPFRPHRLPRGQRVLTIWHGESLAKTFGELAGARPPESTWVTSMSTVGRAFRCAEFKLPPERVLITGAPRNDLMMRADRERVRATVLDDPDDLLVLWLPTFRVRAWDGRIDGTPFDGNVPLDTRELQQLDAWLEQHHGILLAKPHPVVPVSATAKYRRIQTIDSNWLKERDLTLYPLLRASDCLITDASTVWVDFLLNDRPIIFFFPDLEAYRRTRGLSLEPYEDWVPGPLIKSLQELLRELQTISDGNDPHADERRSARRRFHHYADGRSTDRVLDALGLFGDAPRP
jgi:CDP-glycerol glycerophosphotransferase